LAAGPSAARRARIARSLRYSWTRWRCSGPPGRRNSRSPASQDGENSLHGSRDNRSSIPCSIAEYAIQIARDWNVKDSGAGFVTRFDVDAEFLRRYPVHTVGSSVHRELWVPAEELAEFNRHIVGPIEVIAEFGV